MESRIFRIFLINAVAPWLVTTGAVVSSAHAQEPEQVVRPELERRELKEADIDTEDFEIGAFAGAMSVEDFGTNLVYGARLGYHVTEDVFVEASYGRTDTDETSAERFSGFQILEEDDRDLDYYNLSFGFNLFPGESFIGSKWAFTSDFYIIGGVGSTDFAGEDNFTWNAGFGYKVLANTYPVLNRESGAPTAG